MIDRVLSKALLLGAGFVTKPTVQVLSDAGVEVIVGRLFPTLRQLYLTYHSISLPDSGKCEKALP